jgi:hypothetical protein
MGCNPDGQRFGIGTTTQVHIINALPILIGRRVSIASD